MKLKISRNEDEIFEIEVRTSKTVAAYFTAYDNASQYGEKGRNGYWIVEQNNKILLRNLRANEAKEMVKNLAKNYMRTH